MKLISIGAKYIPQKYTIDGIYKHIEAAARTCYKSESIITNDTAQKMFKYLTESKHLSPLEHGIVYLDIEYDCSTVGEKPYHKYLYNSYSKVIFEDIDDGDFRHAYITTNMRVLYENNWMDDLKYLCEPTEHHIKAYTVRCNADIGITREGNRHRHSSPSEESTRYCNYSKDKFGNELSIILAPELENTKGLFFSSEHTSKEECENTFKIMCRMIAEDDDEIFKAIDVWFFANLAAEWSYLKLIYLGWTPQQARRVLPLDLKSEIVYTAFEDDWKHFLDLRYKGTTGKPHPDMLVLATQIYKELSKLKQFTYN